MDEDWGPGDGDDGRAGVPIVIAGTGGHSLIPFGRIHPASRSRVAGRYGILKIVPNYPSLGRWVQAFKTTDGQTLDRVEMRCHDERPAGAPPTFPVAGGSSPRPGLALGISGRDRTASVEHGAVLGHEPPFVAGRVQDEPETMGVADAALAVRSGAGEAQQVGAAGADHELADPLRAGLGHGVWRANRS